MKGKRTSRMIEPAEDNLRGAKAWVLAYGSIYIYAIYISAIKDTLYNIGAIRDIIYIALLSSKARTPKKT